MCEKTDKEKQNMNYKKISSTDHGYMYNEQD